jgi:type IV fimbrial biogenesis protein FimT
VLTRQHAGFSIIELMIAVGIMALLVVMGLPSFTTYMQNSRIRAMADTFNSGIQAARAEAVRRNAPVEFVLTTDDAINAYVNTVNLSTNATNWIVRAPDPAVPGSYLFVQGKSITEGGANVQVSGGGTTSITFNGFGATTLGSAATFAFTSPTGGACAPTGTTRCLNVVVSIGGQAKLCDPAIDPAVSPNDTRRC